MKLARSQEHIIRLSILSSKSSIQVQEAVGQVAQTTQVSSGVVENLSFKSQKQLQELQEALR